jgi:hypothetical protein
VDTGALFPLGGQTLTMDGSTQTLTLPSTCSIVEIDAETAAVYYQINGLAVDALAHGYVPRDGARFIGPLADEFTMTIWGTAAGAAVAHIQYFRAA